MTRLLALLLTAAAVSACSSPSGPEALTQLETTLGRFPGPINYYPRKEHQNSLVHAGETCTIPTGGAQRVLVLPVLVDDYSTAPSSVDTAAELQSFLFGTPSGRTTMTNYFQAVSRGGSSPLVLTGDVKEWRPVHLSNSTGNTTDGSEVPSASDPLISAALTAFASEVDFTQYDSNGDGCIDWLLVVHSGPDEAITRRPEDVWSHFEYYWPPTSRQNADGKQLWGAALLSVRDPIGVWVHEFSHALGLPDLYSYGPPNKSIVGRWSLMDLGMWGGASGHQGEQPTSLDPWSMVELGWATPTVVSSSTVGATVTTPTGSAPQIVKVPLPARGSPPADHYFLLEARKNSAARGATGFIDDALPASGVLVWEIDEGGVNAFGALRQAITVADAYPNESVRGIAPEALLEDAPFQIRANGVSYRFEGQGIRADVTGAASNGYTLDLVVDGTARPELRARFIRTTSDPHAQGSTLQLGIEVANVGSATATGVQIELANLASRTWLGGNSFSIGSLAAGATVRHDVSMSLSTPGHLDLNAVVTATNAPEKLLHDRAYVQGAISAFDVAAFTSLNARMGIQAADIYDYAYQTCHLEIGSSVAACEGSSPPSRCAECTQYKFAPRVQDLPADYCLALGGSRPCRGEITGIWVEDFLGNGSKQILVQSRDLTENTRCVVNGCVSAGLRWSMLSLYALESGALVRKWELVPSESTVQPYACSPQYGGGVEVAGKPIQLPGHTGKSVYVTGFCGDAAGIFSFDTSGTATSQTIQPLNVGAPSILAATTGYSAPGAFDYLVETDTSFPNREPRMFTFASTPAFTPASYLVDLFTAPYEAVYGAGQRIQTYVSGVPKSPKAFFADVNGDAAEDIVYADGNGINSSRLLVFSRVGGVPQMTVIRRDWGNINSALQPLDWDGDGSAEIVLANAAENSIHVFKHLTSSDTYAEIFNDSFGGYTGTGYNPALAVGDVDGNGTRDVVLGQGGHCSVPTVGAGVYVYGLGMVWTDGDNDGNGTQDTNPGMGVFAVGAGDLDGDGKDEVIAGSQSGRLYVLKYRQATSQAPTLSQVP